jgi:hypothetical protein
VLRRVGRVGRAWGVGCGGCCRKKEKVGARVVGAETANDSFVADDGNGGEPWVWEESRSLYDKDGVMEGEEKSEREWERVGESWRELGAELGLREGGGREEGGDCHAYTVLVRVRVRCEVCVVVVGSKSPPPHQQNHPPPSNTPFDPPLLPWFGIPHFANSSFRALASAVLAAAFFHRLVVSLSLVGPVRCRGLFATGRGLVSSGLSKGVPGALGDEVGYVCDGAGGNSH